MENSIQLISRSEIPRAAKTLHGAFRGDPMFTWLCGSTERYEKEALQLFESWICYCVKYGRAIRTEGFESVALRRKPGKGKITFWQVVRSGMMGNRKSLGKEGFSRLMCMDGCLKKAALSNMGESPYWYCWLLGTLPEKRGKGYGGALVRETFALADKQKLPCYLETVTDSSLSVHMHCGYQELSRVSIPESDLRFICMVRKPTPI